MPKEAKKRSKAKTGDLQCPECGHRRVRTTPQEHTFTYGVGDNAARLTAILPFRRCQNCDLEFIDHVAEELMHEAVCRHLGVMTPSEIKKLRQGHGLSRQEFAELTKLGEATIARWERGSLIQNAANDQLLYLLTFAENVKKLRSRAKERRRTTGASNGRANG